jgi:hypothetical protein
MRFQFNLYIWQVMKNELHISTTNWALAPNRSFTPTRRRP